MIGKVVTCGWNGGKMLGGRMCNAIGNSVRIEAMGRDWVVVRMTDSNEVFSAVFEEPKSPQQILQLLKE